MSNHQVVGMWAAIHIFEHPCAHTHTKRLGATNVREISFKWLSKIWFHASISMKLRKAIEKWVRASDVEIEKEAHILALNN